MNQYRYGHYFFCIIFILYVSSASAMTNNYAPEFEKYTTCPVDSVVFGEHVSAVTSEQIEATPQSLVPVNLGTYTSMLHPTLECMHNRKKIIRKKMINFDPGNAVRNHPTIDDQSFQKICDTYRITRSAVQKLSTTIDRITANICTVLEQDISAAKNSLTLQQAERARPLGKLSGAFGRSKDLDNEITQCAHRVEYLPRVLNLFTNIQQDEVAYALYGSHYIDGMPHTIRDSKRDRSIPVILPLGSVEFSS